MPLFWIVHEIDGKRRILIQEGSTLIFARLEASIAGFDGDCSSRRTGSTISPPRRSRRR